MKYNLPEEIKRKADRLNTILNAFGLFSRIIKTGHLSRIINYDPENIIPHLQVPVFSIYGEKDDLVPPGPNSEKLIEGLEKGGNKHYEIHIVPNAEHEFNIFGDKEKIAPEFLEVLDRLSIWFEQNFSHWDIRKGEDRREA